MTLSGNNGSKHRDPEVRPTPARRQFSAEEKLRILAEVDACTERGEIGQIIEDVYQTKGIHSALGYLTPVEFGAAYHLKRDA